MAWQLATFARLCALRHLDLDIVRIGKIFGRHAKAARGHLLDPAAHGIAIIHRREAMWFLAAFARVRAATDAVHGNRQRRMRFMADRAEAHRACAKAFDDFGSRLNLVNADRRFCGFELHQPANGEQAFGLLVYGFGEVGIVR